MNDRHTESGFSAVELLITLLIGFLFIMMGFQLYTVSIQGSGDAREQSKLSNLGYEKLRTLQATTGTLTCPSSTTDSTVDGGKATMVTAITCPSTTLTSLRLIVVTVTANSSQRKVSHAIYVTR